jgi:hypothetical protein
MIHSSSSRRIGRPLFAVFGLILLSTVALAVTGLGLEETTSLDPAPVIAVGGALAGIGAMALARRIDQRSR